MDKDRDYCFLKLYEQLASLTQIVNQKPETRQIEKLLNEISSMFRLAKGVTHFYKNPGDEQCGVGETMISYDIGAENIKPVHTVRFVTKLLAITTMTVYMTEDEEQLTEEELFKVDLTMRIALAFISRNRLQVMAEELAFFDDMGFRNIRSFFRFLAWNSKPGDFNGMAAIQYNLRHFALVNEGYGRSGGDMVLKNHYKYIVNLIGKGCMVSRLGGDTFVCVCRQTDLPELLEYLDDAVVLANPNGKTVNISASAGVFKIPEGYTVGNPNDIMGKIIQAYQIAQTGENGHIVFYSDMMLTMKERAKKICKMLPDALKNNEFHVFYQPKVNINTGEICGAEALCRWFHDGQILSPMEFIPILERTSEICKVDFHMLDQVCSHLRKWLDAGKKAGRISVNFSRRHMANPDLVDQIIEIIDRHSVPHEYIEIELTETTTDVEFRDLKRVVEDLQEHGLCTTVDDFGMGYSSLNLIRVVPWNVLKVDRVFVPLDDEATDSARCIMFKHVIAMAKELGLECIIEGVETNAQVKILRDFGCDKVQGYLFDKPLPIEDFEQRLDMQRYDID